MSKHDPKVQEEWNRFLTEVRGFQEGAKIGEDDWYWWTHLRGPSAPSLLLPPTPPLSSVSPVVTPASPPLVSAPPITSPSSSFITSTPSPPLLPFLPLIPSSPPTLPPLSPARLEG